MFRLIGFIGKDKVLVEWVDNGVQEVLEYHNGQVIFNS